jgi:hypothetical protein
MSIKAGQFYERDGKQCVVAKTGGTDDAPLYDALRIADGQAYLHDLKFLPLEKLQESLAGWTLIDRPDNA